MVLNVGFEEAMLFFWSRICFGVESVGFGRMIVVAPLSLDDVSYT